MDEFVYFTIVPDNLTPNMPEVLYWSMADGWIGWESREVSTFSHFEIITQTVRGTAPINPPHPVYAFPVEIAREMRFMIKAHLN